MKLSIKNNDDIYEINVERLSQWTGSNFKMKNFCVDSLYKYFSGYKYSDYENNYYENVMLNGERVGRKYVKIYKISGKEDVLKQIKISKTSMMLSLINEELKSFNNQSDLELINNVLIKIYENINQSLGKNINNVKLDFEREELWDIIQKSIVTTNNGKNVDVLSEYELIDSFIDEIRVLQKNNPEKVLIIIENIDHMITRDNYKKIYNKIINLCEVRDVYFILTNSTNGYTVIDEEFIEGVSVFNDVLFSLPELERIEDFIKNNYPIERCTFNRNDMSEVLENVVDLIGRPISNYMENMIYLKMINESLMIKNSCKYRPGQIELNYLLE